MPCLRFRLRRLFPLYLDHAAPPALVARIEQHLLACGACRAQLVHLRDAKSLLDNVRPMEVPPFDRVMSRPPAAAAPRPLRIVPPFVRHLVADVAIAATLFLVFTLLYSHTASARNRLFDLSEFRPLPLPSINETHDPHVIVQGVVSRMRGEREEENRRFRLSDPNNTRAFVVCELLDGDPLKMPRAGSRVRVWGVTRYDSNPNHQWFEIHPVLKVEVLP